MGPCTQIRLGARTHTPVTTTDGEEVNNLR